MKLGCTASPCWQSQGWEMSWARNFRIRLKMLWMMFMTGAAFSVSSPLKKDKEMAGFTDMDEYAGKLL